MNFDDYGAGRYEEHYAMGDMADDQRDWEMCEESGRAEITRDSIWQTKDGQRIAVKNLEDSHLLNIIRCFRNMSPHGTKVMPSTPSRRRMWVNAMANEAYRRGLKLDELTEKEPVHE